MQVTETTPTHAMAQMIRQALSLADNAPITIEELQQLLASDDATPEIVLAVAGYSVAELAAAQAQVADLASTISKGPRLAARAALACLSYSELQAVEAIFQELPESGGLLVASKVADGVLADVLHRTEPNTTQKGP